jgi:hypothetical protein
MLGAVAADEITQAPLIQAWTYFLPRDLTGAATPHTISHTLSMGRETKKTELLPGTLEMLILKTLECNAESMHGYAIALRACDGGDPACGAAGMSRSP